MINNFCDYYYFLELSPWRQNKMLRVSDNTGWISMYQDDDIGKVAYQWLLSFNKLFLFLLNNAHLGCMAWFSWFGIVS